MQVSSIITMEDTPELRLGVRCVLLQLFEHNEKAYRSAVQMMEECGKAAIVHPTGTGKSYIAFKLIEEHHGKREYFSLSLPTGIHSSGSFHYTAASHYGTILFMFQRWTSTLLVVWQ